MISYSSQCILLLNPSIEVEIEGKGAVKLYFFFSHRGGELFFSPADLELLGRMTSNGIPVEPTKTPPADPPFPLTDVDRWVLSLTDEEFQYHDWDDMKKIISMSRSLL